MQRTVHAGLKAHVSATRYIRELRNYQLLRESLPEDQAAMFPGVFAVARCGEVDALLTEDFSQGGVFNVNDEVPIGEETHGLILKSFEEKGLELRGRSEIDRTVATFCDESGPLFDRLVDVDGLLVPVGSRSRTPRHKELDEIAMDLMDSEAVVDLGDRFFR